VLVDALSAEGRPPARPLQRGRAYSDEDDATRDLEDPTRVFVDPWDVVEDCDSMAGAGSVGLHGCSDDESPCD